MRKKIIYVAFDGKEFDTEKECCEHEEKRKDLVKVSRAIDTIQNYCREKDCVECPFFSPLQDCKLKMPLEWED